MDDVDRLFECFKCGITPPQSAVRERKRSKSRLKQEVSGSSDILSPESAAPKPKKPATTNSPLEKTSVSTKSKTGNSHSEKRFSPVMFYGSPNGVPPKRPSRLLLRLLCEIRAHSDEQRRLSLSTEIWSTFPRQDEAMKVSKGHEHARVFSYQDHFTGQRRFLVSTYKEFWKRYKIMDPKFRHLYEVIQEGLPCHLYFDLEFSQTENPDRDGDEMVDLLISQIFEALLDKYAIQGNHDWIFELDSSNEVKFSRHLIIRVPNTAFKDNSHAGAFVNEICARISSRKDSDGQLEKLFIRKESTSAESASQLFVDTAVYSRNRCFRLALSSKAGKNSVLLPSGRYKFKDMCEEDMFMNSLICNMDSDCEKYLVCKMDALCMKTLQFDTEINQSSKRHYGPPAELNRNDWKFDGSTTYVMGKSPFPDLDAFIESVASTGNVSGKIRSWYLLSDYRLMVYSMSRNRYCERIGREHKSNHVMYVVDLRRADYYQKCYDPDCRGYRSPLRPIPWEIIPDMVPDEAQNDIYNLKPEPNIDESEAGTSTPDSWWLEVSRQAEKIEKTRGLSQLTPMEYINEDDEDDDDSWCLAVEKIALQSELSQSISLR